MGDIRAQHVIKAVHLKIGWHKRLGGPSSAVVHPPLKGRGPTPEHPGPLYKGLSHLGEVNASQKPYVSEPDRSRRFS